MEVKHGSAGSTRPALSFSAAAEGDPVAPETLPWSLTEQVPAGDAPLGDGSLHGIDGGGEDVGLLENLGQLGTVQGAEGGGVVLLSALVQLQHGELIAPGLGIPVLVLQREGGAASGLAAGPAGHTRGGTFPVSYMWRKERNYPTPRVSSWLRSSLAFRVVFSRLSKVYHKKKRILKISGSQNSNS